MKISIIGASGFVGKNLTKFLRDQGEEVLTDKVNILQHDDIKNLFNRKPDVIINLASYGNDSLHDQKTTEGINKTLRTNIPIDLICEFLTSDTKLFIQAGSSSEYGIHNTPLSVDTPPKGETPYSYSKELFSSLLQSLSIEGKTLRTLRLFSVYGPHEAQHRFIPTLLRVAQTDETIPLSEGSHDFIHVDDVCRSFYRIIQDPHSVAPITHSASGNQLSNQEVVQCIEKVTGKKINTYSKILRSFDSPCWVSDKKDILIQPEISFEEGIQKLWESQLNNS